MKPLSVSVSLSDILEGENRLDATFYASDVYLVKRILKDCENNSIPINNIKDYSKGTFNPPPIKRIFTDDKKLGTPYMLPQEMFNFVWEPRKYVLADKMENIEDWFLKRDWIVLTQSGTVGKPYFINEEDEGIVLSQNAIRILPKDGVYSGYLYAYLSTWIGQTLLKKDEFGITVKHIRPHHVDAIPIPHINEDLQKEIHNNIKEAFALKAKANDLIEKSKKIIYETLGAPEDNLFDDEEEENRD
jgi:type I restriction enzyme S subunit